MVATEIKNGTDGNLYLKEGGAGVYRDIKVLDPGKKQIIEIDPNQTYREYLVVSTTGDKVFVTSDDCIDNSIITIIVRDGKYVFDAVPRGEAKPADQSQGGFVAKILKKVWPGKK
jgi:hypothetical protein